MKILLVAGGTGGHIWPAISFRDWIAVNYPDSTVRFVCGSRAIEEEIFSHAGIFPTVLPTEGSPLWGSLRTRIRRWKDLIRAIIISKKLIGDWKPDICVLFGGYVSFPVIFASFFASTPMIIHEQNAKAGKVTRFAASFGIPVCTGWENCLPLKKGKFTNVGVPVRRMKRLPPEDAWNKLGFGISLPPSPRILVLGGSLGSDPVYRIFREASLIKPFRDWSILLLGTGAGLEHEGPNLWILPREWDIGRLYSIADVVVARAGASTLSELIVFGLPSVIIPWRGASDDHQMENAMLFLKQGHGSIWEKDNGVLQNLGFMIDYEHKRTTLGQSISCPGKSYSNACEKLWNFVQKIVEGRGRN